MAEWSMAVVLKTYIFPPNFTPIFAISGHILLDRGDLRGKVITDHRNFSGKLLI